MNCFTRLAAFATIALALAGPATSNAQELNFGALNQEQPNIVHLRTGADYGFVVGAGYSYRLRIANRQLILFGDLTSPWADPDFADYRLKLGVMAPLMGENRWKLIGRLAPILRGIKNDLNRMTNLGADLELVTGYYAPGWFIAGELGFDWAIATRIEHSDRYRSTIYAEAKNGWYATPGGNFNFDLLGGVSFRRYDLLLRLGQARDLEAEPQLLPFYVTSGINVRF